MKLGIGVTNFSWPCPPDQIGPTVTRAAARMEAAGLLRRERHEKDRRLVRLFLTDRGRALEQVIGREIDDLSERALASLDESERAALIRFLDSIGRNLG